MENRQWGAAFNSDAQSLSGENKEGQWQDSMPKRDETADFSGSNEAYDQRESLKATTGVNDEDRDDDDDDTGGDDQSGEWGSVDPAEDNSPFGDSNDPSGPGSAV